jgi:F-box/WD-40 domain protein MET30
VTCVGLSDSRMASGSEDGEIRVYSFRNVEQAAAKGETVLDAGTPRS